MTQKDPMLLICYAWKSINDPNITDKKVLSRYISKADLGETKLPVFFLDFYKRKEIKNAHFSSSWWFTTVLLTHFNRVEDKMGASRLRYVHRDAQTQTHSHMHKTKHIYWSLYCSGNINRSLEAFLNIHWRGIKRSLLTTCNTITPQTDKQTKTMTKHARQRITQSTCKLISLACKVKHLAGEQGGKKKLGTRNGAGQEKTADKNKIRHYADLIFQIVYCFLACNSAIPFIFHFFISF